MTTLHNPLRSNTKAVVFDVGGVLIDLHAEGARRELIEKYGFVSQSFARLTRSSFESHPRSITELAMIGCVGTSEYLDAFLHEQVLSVACCPTQFLFTGISYGQPLSIRLLHFLSISLLLI
jgi:hypothetical protein